MTDRLDTMADETLAAIGAAERHAYRSAYGIATIGASNTAGVALTVHQTIVSLRAAGLSHRAVDTHPAVRAMVGHLSYLTGQGLGPTSEDLATVTAVHESYPPGH